MLTITPIRVNETEDASYIIAQALAKLYPKLGEVHYRKCLSESTPQVLYWRARAGNMFVVKRYGVIIAVFSVEDFGTNAADCELGTLFVHPYFQRSGVGTLCIEYAEAFAKSFGKNTMYIYSMPTSFEFYRRNGYKFTEQQFGEGYLSLFKRLS